MAVSGDSALVGAHWEDAEGNNAGAAYVFEQPTPTPTNTPPNTPTPTPTNTPTNTPTPTPTDTPTPAPVPPTPIGGIGIFPGVPGDAADTGGAAVLTWLAGGAVAGALALGGAAWYARRRLWR